MLYRRTFLQWLVGLWAGLPASLTSIPVLRRLKPFDKNKELLKCAQAAYKWWTATFEPLPCDEAIPVWVVKLKSDIDWIARTDNVNAPIYYADLVKALKTSIIVDDAIYYADLVKVLKTSIIWFCAYFPGQRQPAWMTQFREVMRRA